MDATAAYGRVFERERIRQDLHALEDRIIQQRDALIELTADSLHSDRLAHTLTRVAEVTSSTLGVQRVSIWRFNASRTAIECLDLYDAARERHTLGETLLAADFPRYFRSLHDAEIVAVDDALSDARTSEFADSYLRPLSIASMMDVPIHCNGAAVGVLCNEHTGERRTWSADEKAFGISISNLISLALERCERQRIEADVALRSAALNATAHPVLITDPRGNIVWTNPAFSAVMGYSAPEVIGRNAPALLGSGEYNPEPIARMWETVDAGQVWRGELWNRRKDGSRLLIDQTITPVKDAAGMVTHLVAIKIDLTQQRSLESQFLQAQKMEVVGRLAGGIAHDFNNLLTVINGTAELALTDLPKDHPLREDFERIQESGARAAGLTRQLLTFSRKQIVNRVPLQITQVLTGFKSMLQRLIGEDIKLEVRSGCGASGVMADQGQLEQVILNLAVNARDAMPRGGTLLIDASIADLDTGLSTAQVKVPPGSYVRIDVSDTGEGMSDDVLSRIFEPFFTTKESGKGTGLGLATVYAIVEQSGGAILAVSTVGEGTTFTIYLPRIGAAAATAPLTPARPAHADGGTVLVVEDDASVREVAVAILKAAGYVTVSAGEAGEALRILSNHPKPVNLIVTDVVLPGMGGRELASHAFTISPATPVLFTSGHTDDLVLAHGVRENLVHFIGKPYTPSALRNKVRDVLRAARQEARA